MNPFPQVVFSIGPVAITDTMLVSLALSVLLITAGVLLRFIQRARVSAELLYETLESAAVSTTATDVVPLVPLVLTQWLFIGAANLAGLIPRVASPTRDLSLTAALALISFLAGHIYALRVRGLSYLRQYIEPHPLLLPFNLIGELSRTLALALRLFGNMLSGGLIGAIAVYLVGLLLPVPLMLLSVLTGVVQAYIFGVLTLVFAASSIATADRPRPHKERPSGDNK